MIEQEKLAAEKARLRDELAAVIAKERDLATRAEAERNEYAAAHVNVLLALGPEHDCQHPGRDDACTRCNLERALRGVTETGEWPDSVRVTIVADYLYPPEGDDE